MSMKRTRGRGGAETEGRSRLAGRRGRGEYGQTAEEPNHIIIITITIYYLTPLHYLTPHPIPPLDSTILIPHTRYPSPYSMHSCGAASASASGAAEPSLYSK